MGVQGHDGQCEGGQAAQTQTESGGTASSATCPSIGKGQRTQPQFRLDDGALRSGAFVHFTEQELALHTMACLRNDVCVRKVRVQRLVHADLTLDTVVIAGVFDEFLPITITAPVVVEVAAGAEVEEEVGEPVEEPVEGQEGMQAPLTSCFFSMLSRGWWHGCRRGCLLGRS